MNQQRIGHVLSRMEEMGLHQFLVTDPKSIRYLTGYSVDPYERFFALLLRSDGQHVLFLNRLFPDPGQEEAEIVWFSDTDGPMPLVEEHLIKGEILGVDKDLRARFLVPLMQDGAAAGFVNASIAVDRTRGIKDAEEIALMRKASAINDEAMEKFRALVHEGVTEKEIADQLLEIYRSLGASGYSFSPIVSFGKNAADPHHEPDGTLLQDGDCVLFDVGCVYEGYCSDMTRTFYYRTVSDHCRGIYDLVRSANEKAESLIRPGTRLCEIDAAARDLITAAGYGPQFNHRLGHFIGQTDHEYGDVSSAYDWPVEAGMIFSIEPGVYLTGDTGVRVEDLVLVTEDGVERLNHYSKELTILP